MCLDEHENNLFEYFKTTEEIPVPKMIIDQVIGQEHAVAIIKKAAPYRRNILLLGPPGTGKSMLGRAYAELMPKEPRPDVLVYPNFDNPNSPEIVLLEEGLGKHIIKEFTRIAAGETLKAKIWQHIPTVIISIIYALYLVFTKTFDLSLFLFTLLVIISIEMLSAFKQKPTGKSIIPNLIISNEIENNSEDDDESEKNSFSNKKSHFIDATGVEVGRLLGDVKHDPYETGGLGTPPHERVMPGAIHLANKRVLFIDEIGTLSYDVQISLLTAMQERKYPITGRSKGSTAAVIQTQAVPCDFALVAAGNYETLEQLHPAFRSRFLGYGYEVKMNEYIDDNPKNRYKLIQFIAQEVKRWRLLPFTREACYEVINIARMLSPKQNTLTLYLRELGGYVRIASDIASSEKAEVVKAIHVKSAIELLTPIETQKSLKFILEKEVKMDYGIIKVVNVVSNCASLGLINVNIIDSRDPSIKIIGLKEDQELMIEYVERSKNIIQAILPNAQIFNKQIFVEVIGDISPIDTDLSLALLLALFSEILQIRIPSNVTAAGGIDIHGNIFQTRYVGIRLYLSHKANISKLVGNVVENGLEPINNSKIKVISVKTAEELLNLIKENKL